MLRNIDDTYFNDPKIDSLNKTLFVFASYNAGPNRIARLRKEAPDMGLDPNVWFNNVELVAAKDIGQETVTYVANIYKYYVAYKLAVGAEADSGKGEGGASGRGLADGYGSKLGGLKKTAYNFLGESVKSYAQLRRPSLRPYPNSCRKRGPAHRTTTRKWQRIGVEILN